MNMNKLNIVFFDGLCGLCSEFIDFVIKIDKKSLFKFSPLQSDFAKSHLPPELTNDLSTVVIIIEGRTLTKAQAVLQLFQVIGGIWKLPALMRFLPKPFLNFCYDKVAKYRYLILPKKETCRLPTKEEREKFIL